MIFRIIGGAILAFCVIFYIWGDRIRMAQGDTMLSIDYPLAAYRAYRTIYTDYPKSPLRKAALEKMRDLEKSGYVKDLLKSEKHSDKKVQNFEKSEAAKKYH